MFYMGRVPLCLCREHYLNTRSIVVSEIVYCDIAWFGISEILW